MAIFFLLAFQDADAVARALSESTVSIDVERRPLAEAVAELLAKAELVAAFDDDAGAAPVTLTLTDVRLRTALRLLLKPHGLTMALHDGELRIVREEDARAAPRMQRYKTAALVRRLDETADREGIHERRREYLADQDPDAQIGVVSDGVVLDVRPIVLPDRRYVMLEMRPLNAQLQLPLDTVEILIFMGGDARPPFGDPEFGESLLEELLETHAGTPAALVNGELWVYAPESVQARVERLLSGLAALK